MLAIKRLLVSFGLAGVVLVVARTVYPESQALMMGAGEGVIAWLALFSQGGSRLFGRAVLWLQLGASIIWAAQPGLDTAHIAPFAVSDGLALALLMLGDLMIEPRNKTIANQGEPTAREAESDQS